MLHCVLHLLHAMLERVDDLLQFKFLLSHSGPIALFKLSLDIIDFVFQLILVVDCDWFRLGLSRVLRLLFLVINARDGLA